MFGRYMPDHMRRTFFSQTWITNIYLKFTFEFNFSNVFLLSTKVSENFFVRMYFLLSEACSCLVTWRTNTLNGCVLAKEKVSDCLLACVLVSPADDDEKKPSSKPASSTLPFVSSYLCLVFLFFPSLQIMLQLFLIQSFGLKKYGGVAAALFLRWNIPFLCFRREWELG